MRIGMVLDTRFPPDIRVEKEISLLNADHQIYMLCPRRGDQAAEEEVTGVRIRRVFSTPQRWWESVQVLATCSSIGWKQAMQQYVKANQLEALHIHDLPLLGTAIKVAREANIPVVADLHEDYPSMLADALHKPDGDRISLNWLIQRSLVSVAKWRRYESQAVPQADAVIVVIEEARERLLRLGIKLERIQVVANYAPLADLAEALPAPDSDKFKVVYAGGFDSERDLSTVIDAVALLPLHEMPDLQVTLMGGVGIALEALRQRATQKQVLDRVELMDWRPVKEVKAHIQSSQVCLVPHVKTPLTDATIPHKLFQYMAQRRPVIVSNCAPLERIINETRAGLVYTSGQARELAECLRRLYDNPTLRDEMAERGYQAVRDKYNWEQTGQALVELYGKLETRKVSN